MAMVFTVVIYIYVIGSEKTTLMAQNYNKFFLCRAEVSSVRLFQAHSAFCCVVVVANAKRCSRMQNEKIVSK